MIQIVNWLLTRHCNLKCDYCRLVRNYKKPKEYPFLDYYLKNQMSSEYIIECLRRFKLYNPDIFHVFLGGEPMLRNDLHEIIQYCHDENINYTIISNCTDEVKPFIHSLIEKVGELKGLTFSMDLTDDVNSIIEDQDRFKKSIESSVNILEFLDKIKDPVAEITIDNNTIDKVYDVIEILSDNNIISSITFTDVAKTRYYDFSNITDRSVLVKDVKKVHDLFDKIIKNNLKVHMFDSIDSIDFVGLLLTTTQSNYDCGMDENLTTLTIDADGNPRLCLRILGIETKKLKLMNYLKNDGTISRKLYENIYFDKVNHCFFCNWTCPMMSNIIDADSDKKNSLIHTEKRG